MEGKEGEGRGFVLCFICLSCVSYFISSMHHMCAYESDKHVNTVRDKSGSTLACRNMFMQRHDSCLMAQPLHVERCSRTCRETHLNTKIL